MKTHAGVVCLTTASDKWSSSYIAENLDILGNFSSNVILNVAPRDVKTEDMWN